MSCVIDVFFFQAEDGIRDIGVTGVQTCALPILQAVAAVVIGGVAIFGGSGTVWGAAIGAFLLVTINRALPSLGIEDFWQRAVIGALILNAIVLDRVLAARQAKKLAEARDHS